jgi:hypothetical protein
MVVDADNFLLVRAKVFGASLKGNQNSVSVTDKTDRCTSLLHNQKLGPEMMSTLIASIAYST